jgi:two-component system cell cycle response regulator
MKVLIADDSVISRRLLEAALRRWDYEVVAVANGVDAWEHLQQTDAPQLAILDWMMPGLSGPEVCRLVRQNSKTNQQYTYILLVTSKSEKEDLLEGMEAGADDYITKPFDQSELKVRLGSGRRIVELQEQVLAAQAALREQATRDSLTKVWNRNSVLEILERELARAVRESSPVGIVMGDLDLFKQVNDTYGHIVGDAVLRETARRMQISVRQYDAVGRYGGEEFLIVLPGCEGPDAESLAERMRLEIGQQPFDLPERQISITTSFGVTALPRHTVAGGEALIHVADVALYQAKQKGRNRTIYLPYD